MKSLTRKDLLVCLSLANLCLVDVWRVIIFDGALFPYWTWHDLAAAVLLLLGLTVVFSGMVVLGRMPRFSLLAIDAWIYVLPLLKLTELAYHHTRSSQIWTLLFDYPPRDVFMLVLILIPASVLIRKRLGHVAEVIVICMMPLLPLLFVESLWVVAKAPPPPVLAGSLQGTRPTSKRFVWIVFDMTDWRYVSPSLRPSDLQLPAFDRMMATSLWADKAIQAGPVTVKAMPTIIYARPVEIRLSPGSSLLVDREDNQIIDGTALPTIFQRVRNLGMNASVLGWELPYCQLFGSELSRCEREAENTSTLAEASLLNSLRSEAITLLPSPLAKRQRHLLRYKRMLSRAIQDATDPSLNLVLLHLPVPHIPAIFDSKSQRTTIFNLGYDVPSYLDNLKLADLTLGEIRSAMERANLWDSSTVLVTSDHGVGSRLAPQSGQSGPLIPYMLKLAGQKEESEYRESFNAVATAGLIEAIARGEVSTPGQAVAWLNQYGDSYTAPAPYSDTFAGSSPIIVGAAAR
jgi:hypothetical protein